MKHLNFIYLFFIGIFLLTACEKVEEKIKFEGGVQPILTANTTSVNLQPGIESQMAIRFNWTNPEYKFTTGTSSQDVTYTLQFDTLGANFNSSKRYSTSYSKDLTTSFTVGELNGILGNVMLLQLNPRRTYTMQARVVSTIGTGINPTSLYSAPVNFTVSPFTPPPKVDTPTLSTLWIIGNAVGSGWNNPLTNPYDVNQKFTRVNATTYELTIAMPGGGAYKLIQENGVWGSQYHMLDGGTWEGGNFEKRDADPAFPGPPTSGTYKITVNFQTGVFSVVKL